MDLNERLARAIERKHLDSEMVTRETSHFGVIGGSKISYIPITTQKITEHLVTVKLPSWLCAGAIITTRGVSGSSPYRVHIARPDMCWVAPFGQPACDGWAVETITLLRYWY